MRTPALVRQLMWRLGRKMYTYARGDGLNDPHTNGEYQLLEQVLAASQGSRVLLDVGANKGDWSAHALEAGGSSPLHIHSFEPSMATRKMLTARFASTPAVTVQPFALSETEGEAKFYSNEVGSGTNSLSPASGLNTEVVAQTTVDHFLQKAGVKAVTMMKVDTEGFDLLVLKGASAALRDGVIDIIQFEYNWRWLINHASLRDVFGLIADKPYRLGKLCPGGSIEFYEQWHFELDRFFENNYVLVKNDSHLRSLGSTVRFDGSNVGVQS
jgi:FkbM family methyltransferase